MKLEGRRESTNVEDRRGKKTAAAAGGIGIGGIIIYLIISLLLVWLQSCKEWKQRELWLRLLS